MDKKICGIYKIESPSGRIYIGQSVDIERRWNYHMEMRDAYKHTILYRSLAKYGADKHSFKILEECPKEKLNERERYYIEKYDTFETKHGLNLTKGGDSQVVLSKRTRDKISRAKKGKTIPHLIGFKHSQETKDKLAELAKGNTNWLGKNHSEETKEKIRQANLGKNLSEETIEKLRILSTGRKYPNRKKLTEEARAKISKSQIGRKLNVPRTSIYYGVSMKKNKKSNSWQAVIRINKKHNYIGTFKTEIEAAKAYDKYIREHIPYDIPLNFPEKSAICS